MLVGAKRDTREKEIELSHMRYILASTTKKQWALFRVHFKTFLEKKIPLGQAWDRPSLAQTIKAKHEGLIHKERTNPREEGGIWAGHTRGFKALGLTFLC